MSAVKDFTGVVPIAGTRKRYGYRDVFSWEVFSKGSGFFLVVPSYKEYDFDVSVPKFLEWLVSPHDPILVIASGVHDRMLELGYDEAAASAEFRRVLVAFGYPRFKAWRMFTYTLAVTAIADRLRSVKG